MENIRYSHIHKTDSLIHTCPFKSNIDCNDNLISKKTFLGQGTSNLRFRCATHCTANNIPAKMNPHHVKSYDACNDESSTKTV